MKITQKELSILVEEPYRSRGWAYFQEGLVKLISLKLNHVKAKVIGTALYYVILKHQTHGIDGKCSCPAFEEFGPCKHMAAVGFELLHHETQGEYEPSKEYTKRVECYTTAENLLSKSSKNELITFIYA